MQFYAYYLSAVQLEMLSIHHCSHIWKMTSKLIDQSYQMYPFSILRRTCFLSGVTILGTSLHVCLL